jgi:hypothetical protein
MIWTTIDGRSWSLTIGDKMASIWLIDEVFYGARVWQINNIPTTSTRLGEFDCIENAKRACMEEMNEGEFPILYPDGTDRHIPRFNINDKPKKHLNTSDEALEDIRIWASVIDEATVKEILQEEFIEVNDDPSISAPVKMRRQ